MRPPHVGYPDDRPGRILDTGLDAGSVGLDVAAWCESSRHLLDGVLTRSRLRGLRGWTQARQDGLIVRGFWQSRDDGAELVGYLAVNRSRLEVERLRSMRAAAGAKGGSATTWDGPRDAAGHFARPPTRTPTDTPTNTHAEGGVAGGVLVRLPKQPPKHLLRPSTSTSTSTSFDDLFEERTRGWNAAWRPTLEAMKERRFDPPSEGQRRMLYGEDEPSGLIRDRPNDAARWVRESKATNTYDLVGDLLRRWSGVRKAAS